MNFFKPFCFSVFVSLALITCTADKRAPLDSEKPEDSRFTPVVLTPAASLNEPMVFEVMEDESVYIIERHGNLKKFEPASGTVRVIAHVPVFTESEQGLVGFTVDPDFKTNHWIYLYYAHPTESKFLMTRWNLVNDSLLEDSKKILFEVPSDRVGTSHTGGGMTWDAHGNLYITIGNNTGNSLYSQTDQRRSRTPYDDQRGASNTNDLRGKILRIHPEDYGKYAIPKGNLFPEHTSKTRSEIYTMGNRNPWRISVDSQTGFVYWGEIGPDADSDSEKGPMGYDELNQARGPGFFGWPYFIGENHAYPMYDYINNVVGEKQDPKKPINNSFRNTGQKYLPPAQPAFISYPYRPSEKFPLVGSSSRCAIGGPIFHRTDFKKPARPFPSYYEGKWFAADLSRFWIMAIEMDESGNYKSMEHFAPEYHPRQPIDMKFGPTGDLYVLEYGGNTANSGVESRLVRIEYSSGNRKPVVQVQANKRGGVVPLRVKLTSAGTSDFDGDDLNFSWTITADGKKKQEYAGASTEAVLNEPGVYTAMLTATDPMGASNASSILIVAGNEPPQVILSVEGNRHFFFPDSEIIYSIIVTDQEDGTLADKNISPNEVAVSMDYASEGFDYVQINFGHVEASRYAVALSMMGQSDCRTCHNPETVGVGPSFSSIANKYKNNFQATDSLINRIRNGSQGIWGMETAMPAHPTLSMANARVIVDYIMHINMVKPIAMSGKYVTRVPVGDDGRGTYILRAAYTDRGNGEIPPLASESVIILHSPKVLAVNAAVIDGAIRDQLDEYTFLTAKHNTHIGYKSIDMTGIRRISFIPNWHLYDIYKGGKIEVRLDSPSGELIGTTDLIPGQFNVRLRGAFAPPVGSADEGVKVNKELPPLDLAAFFAPGANKNEFTLPSTAILKETSGVHDIYFAFKNDSINQRDSLFPLALIEFSNKIPK